MMNIQLSAVISINRVCTQRWSRLEKSSSISGLLISDNQGPTPIQVTIYWVCQFLAFCNSCQKKKINKILQINDTTNIKFSSLRFKLVESQKGDRKNWYKSFKIFLHWQKNLHLINIPGAILQLHSYATKPWNKDCEFKENTLILIQTVIGTAKIEQNLSFVVIL